jgi:hypothetical protein
VAGGSGTARISRQAGPLANDTLERPGARPVIVRRGKGFRVLHFDHRGRLLVAMRRGVHKASFMYRLVAGEARSPVARVTVRAAASR